MYTRATAPVVLPITEVSKPPCNALEVSWRQLGASKTDGDDCLGTGEALDSPTLSARTIVALPKRAIPRRIAVSLPQTDATSNLSVPCTLECSRAPGLV